ncbi:hypothetical protein SEA_JINKIES_58 [Arthrobacter phage Jinkies]|uniref:Uncharacterized protein n=1 Tax=Arthrobacter phage Jinkies TaxID=2743903 RepID=A0A7T0IFI2_9CAUD|nr:hypothetical protein SEA_JINKIES_58 [Arthrobacter phage Jinkies]
MTRHAVQDIECPACTTLGGPCATTEPSRVAWPVFVLQKPASMSKLVRVARALKVLHGGDLVMLDRGIWFVWYTPGNPCHCQRCDTFLRELLKADWLDMPAGMIICPECGNKRCPHATDHDEDCTRSNEPGQAGSSYTTPPPGSAREFLDGLARRRHRAIGPEDWPTEEQLRDDLTRKKTGRVD